MQCAECENKFDIETGNVDEKESRKKQDLLNILIGNLSPLGQYTEDKFP